MTYLILAYLSSEDGAPSVCQEVTVPVTEARTTADYDEALSAAVTARKAAFDGLNMAEVERISAAIDSMLEQRVQTTKAGAL